MRTRAAITIPAALRPLLDQPADWPASAAWRVGAAACRASGSVVWAACVQDPNAPEPIWLEGQTESRPSIVQSECVPALIAALESTPVGAAVEVIAPTSLRYLAEGAVFGVGTPERRLAELAGARRVWARYALGELEALTNACLARASPNLAGVRWPGENRLDIEQLSFVLFTDGGCTPSACAAAWVLRRGASTLAERAWTLEGGVARDGVRLAEFAAAADGLAAVPAGATVAVVSDHADVSDFGVRDVPAFRPSRAVAEILRELRDQATKRHVRWFWAEHDETAGQRRCQELIDRQLRAAPAYDRFMQTCRAAGLQRVCVPDFDQWVAPREPLVNRASEEWSATFERREQFLVADPHTARLYVRQLRLDRSNHPDLAAAFLGSRVAGWCAVLAQRSPLAGSAQTWQGQLRSGFALLGLVFEPETALLVQTRPGACLEDALEAASVIEAVDLAV